MLNNQNREALLIKLKGHYQEVGDRVKPLAVSGDYVRRVLRGDYQSSAVDEAAVEYLEILTHKQESIAKQLNARVEKLIK